MAGQGESKASKRRIMAQEKKRRALEMRKVGATYEEIQRALGYKSVCSAWKAVQSALRSMIKEPAEEVRKLELARLDRMFRAYWPKVIQGDIQAGNLVLKIADRRARLLGLDMPVKVAPTDPSGEREWRYEKMSDAELIMEARKRLEKLKPLLLEKDGEQSGDGKHDGR